MQPEPKRSVVDMHPGAPNAIQNSNEGQHGRTQRPSLIDLLTGDLGSRAHINRTPAETPSQHSQPTPVSHPTPPHTYNQSVIPKPAHAIPPQFPVTHPPSSVQPTTNVTRGMLVSRLQV